MRERTDTELIEAARQGEINAFGELVRRYQKQAFAVAVSLVSDAAEAEDLTQEAFIRASRNLDLLVDTNKFGAWLRRITFGVCIDWLRAFRPELYRSSEALEEQAAMVSSNAPSPLERLEQLELAERVLQALAQLPPRYRLPLTLYHIEGLSHEKVAQSLNLPINTVRSLVARARRKLLPLLESYAKEVFVMNSSIEEVFQEQAIARLLHLHNGDSACGTLKQSNVPGVSEVWADVLHEGPVPADLSLAERLEIRARFIAAQGWATYEEALAKGAGWNQSLASYADYDEVILWFEHDLFDQLILIHHLDFFARQNLGQTRLSLICIGEYPGIEPFHGLGQLNTDQLASLLGTRQPVTVEQLKLGQAAWQAFTAPDPLPLDQLARSDTSALPFLAGALRRFLQEYPSTRNGLPRTEQQILTTLATGPKQPIELFRAMYPLEERVFMGDDTFWSRLKGLAAGPQPVIEWDYLERSPLPGGQIRLTEAGRAVLAGQANWIQLNSLDRWLGGVHLQGSQINWRWDEETSKLLVRE